MSTSIIAVFAQSSGVGHVLRLTVSESGTKGITYSDAETDGSERAADKPMVQTALDFDLAAHRAFISVWQILGQPAYLPGVKCAFAALDPTATVPRLEGGSLYGAFSLAFIRLFARDEHKDALRHQFRAQLDRGMRCSDLSKVAVSAEGDWATGEFRPVEGIDQKLKVLARLEDLSFCVLARGQTVPSMVKLPNGDHIVARVTPDQFLHSQNLPKLPIIYAADPMDALGQVFDRQSRALAKMGIA